ncbi:hypothetical protein HDK77DRAFT_76130 [Phyllosticta capitalensis]
MLPCVCVLGAGELSLALAFSSITGSYPLLPSFFPARVHPRISANSVGISPSPSPLHLPGMRMEQSHRGWEVEGQHEQPTGFPPAVSRKRNGLCIVARKTADATFDQLKRM